MNTVVSRLSVLGALESSIPFLTEFIKKHWLIVILYIGIIAVPGFLISGKITDMTPAYSIQLALVGLVAGLAAAFVSLFMSYYGLSMAVSNLDPSTKVFSRSLPKSVWLLFCTHFLLALVSLPLLVLFIIPGIWWLIKSTVACANLLGTDDGPVESIIKSHQLMNNRFWQSFGFLFATGFIIFVGIMIITGSIGLCLFFGGLLHSAMDADSGFTKVAAIFRSISAVISVFGSIIFYYLQAYLYVYLKNTQIVPDTQVMPNPQ